MVRYLQFGVLLAALASSFFSASAFAATVSVSPSGRLVLSSPSTVQFSATVSGASDQAVTYRLSYALGSISPGGVYTPPLRQTGYNTVILTVTSVADPTATAQVSINLAPYEAAPAAVAAALTSNSSPPAPTPTPTPTAGTAPSSPPGPTPTPSAAPSTAPGASVAATITTTPSGRVVVSSGAPVQFTSTVTGLANTSVTYSLSYGLGSITAGGLYTPPASHPSYNTVEVIARAAGSSSLSTRTSLSFTPYSERPVPTPTPTPSSAALHTPPSTPPPTPLPTPPSTPGAVPTSAQVAGLPAPLSAARVAFSGHSLLDSLSAWLAPMASSGGQSLLSADYHVGGSPIRLRADSDHGLSNLRSSTGLNGRTNFDTLVIVENHHIVRNLMWNDTVRYLRLFHDALMTGNRAGQTYFYHPWLDVNKSAPGAWITYEKQAVSAHSCIADRVNYSLEREGRTERIRNIPTSGALVALVERAINQGIPGMSTGTTAERLNQIFVDNVHPTDFAWYYLSLVSYASIYHRSPAELPYRPDSIPAAAMPVLRTLAWDYVRQYETGYVAKTPAQCADLMVNSFCAAFRTVTGDDPSGCRARFQQTSTDNPFYYDAASDRSYWFTP